VKVEFFEKSGVRERCPERAPAHWNSVPGYLGRAGFSGTGRRHEKTHFGPDDKGLLWEVGDLERGLV
jgi:hypothetical protein